MTTTLYWRGVGAYMNSMRHVSFIKEWTERDFSSHIKMFTLCCNLNPPDKAEGKNNYQWNLTEFFYYLNSYYTKVYYLAAHLTQWQFFSSREMWFSDSTSRRSIRGLSKEPPSCVTACRKCITWRVLGKQHQDVIALVTPNLVPCCSLWEQWRMLAIGCTWKLFYIPQSFWKPLQLCTCGNIQHNRQIIPPNFDQKVPKWRNVILWVLFMAVWICVV
jgi:hypothetical protein